MFNPLPLSIGASIVLVLHSLKQPSKTPNPPCNILLTGAGRIIGMTTSKDILRKTLCPTEMAHERGSIHGNEGGTRTIGSKYGSNHAIEEGASFAVAKCFDKSTRLSLPQLQDSS
jgi:hypothetical protein